MRAQNSSRIWQAKLIVRSVVKQHEFCRNNKIATTLICYARLVRDSRNALHRSRTGKNPLFKFIRPDFWTDLNSCRQRLLFAHQLTQQKCSLSSQGYSQRLRYNLTPVSNICKAALISLFWAPSGLNKLPERRFQVFFHPDWCIDNGLFNRPIMARTQILVHGWGPKQEFLCCFEDVTNRG